MVYCLEAGGAYIAKSAVVVVDRARFACTAWLSAAVEEPPLM